jgi:hypothetical protein
MNKLSYKTTQDEKINPKSPSYDDSALSSFHAKKGNAEKTQDRFNSSNTNNLINSKENLSNENFFQNENLKQAMADDIENKNYSHTGFSKNESVNNPQSNRRGDSTPNKSDNFKFTDKQFNKGSVSLNESKNEYDNSRYNRESNQEEYDNTGFKGNQDSRSCGFRTDNTGFNKDNRDEYSESTEKPNISHYQSLRENNSPPRNKKLIKGNRNDVSNANVNNSNMNDIIKRDLHEYLSSLEQQNLLKVKPKENNKWELEFNENNFISKEQLYRNKTEREWNTDRENINEYDY